MIKEGIIELVNGNNLQQDIAEKIFDEIMSGQADDVQKSAFLTALAIKGETIEETTALANIMRIYCEKLVHKSEVLEIVGTGGDKSNSFNISTTSAFVLSAAGISVAKHGNRAASSKCGAADVLEALGVKLDISPEKSSKVLDETGMCFLFAQKYHSAMRHVGAIRKELGFKTVFNLAGPLSNPALPEYQLLGVYSEELLEPMAKVLNNIDVKRGMVVYGKDCLDEISLSDETAICEFDGDKIKKYVISPEQYGFNRCQKSDLTGGNPEENAEITRNILKGEKSARRDSVVLNSMFAYHIVHPETDLNDAKKIIEDTIDSGKAFEKLKQFVNATRED
ncbi:MAG: anthranilate phosphoribosyltransferase [Oscillospiraceae bacterium]|nr:anthranilate phosphoribosyltransferase [Oscillospiraceae bacterium]